jgi:hypothetical protein
MKGLVLGLAGLIGACTMEPEVIYITKPPEKIIKEVSGDSTLIDVITSYDINHTRIAPLDCMIGGVILFGHTDIDEKKMILNSLPQNYDLRRITTLHEVEHIKDYAKNGKGTYTEAQIDSLAIQRFKDIYNRYPDLEVR